MAGDCSRRNNSQCQRRCIEVGDRYSDKHKRNKPKLTQEQIKERKRKKDNGGKEDG